MTDYVNAESVDNLENFHTMLSINKGKMFCYKTAQGIITNKENIRILFDSGSLKSFINKSSNNKTEKGFEAF